MISTSCSASKTDTRENVKSELEKVEHYPNKEIKTGADDYNNYLPLLQEKKIGIVTNQTGILFNKIHLVDFLL